MRAQIEETMSSGLSLEKSKESRRKIIITIKIRIKIKITERWFMF